MLKKINMEVEICTEENTKYCGACRFLVRLNDSEDSSFSEEACGLFYHKVLKMSYYYPYRCEECIKLFGE
jgi:hypothetical protein